MFQDWWRRAEIETNAVIYEVNSSLDSPIASRAKGGTILIYVVALSAPLDLGLLTVKERSSASGTTITSTAATLAVVLVIQIASQRGLSR